MVVDGAVVMVENIVRHLNRPDITPTARRIKSARPRTRFSGPSSMRSASSSPRTFPSSRCRRSKAACSSRWRGRSLLRCSVLFLLHHRSSGAGQLLFPRGAKEWRNLVMEFLARYRKGVTWAIHHRGFTVGVGVAALAWQFFSYLASLDQSSCLISMKARCGCAVRWLHPPALMRRWRSPTRPVCLASFPEATEVVDQIGRPDDGTDALDSSIRSTSST